MTKGSSPRERLPCHGPCFICGPDNPEEMGLDWYAVEATGLFVAVPEFFAEGGAGAPAPAGTGWIRE